VGLAVWAMTTMVRARTTFNPWVASTAVVSSGPFAFTRNPIYVGDALIYVGCAVIFDSLFALLLLPLVLAIVYLGVISREEAYLERKFGATYMDYKCRVRRWL
jgi:protein-S-isoprenylcysteine O-methyltransferase Ste14